MINNSLIATKMIKSNDYVFYGKFEKMLFALGIWGLCVRNNLYSTNMLVANAKIKRGDDIII